ncbi:hypothetical protein ACRAWF_26945, partial [Streptomyces sp. L7]
MTANGHFRNVTSVRRRPRRGRKAHGAPPLARLRRGVASCHPPPRDLGQLDFFGQVPRAAPTHPRSRGSDASGAGDAHMAPSVPAQVAPAPATRARPRPRAVVSLILAAVALARGRLRSVLRDPRDHGGPGDDTPGRRDARGLPSQPEEVPTQLDLTRKVY